MIVSPNGKPGLRPGQSLHGKGEVVRDVGHAQRRVDACLELVWHGRNVTRLDEAEKLVAANVKTGVTETTTS
jgi:hypothetical protein